jgi:predicted nucleotidyltransferase
MTLAVFLQRVIQILDEAGVPYMLTGSLASAYYAVPRATQDIDLVVETEAPGVERLVRGLREAGCYVDRDVAIEAWRSRGQFNAIDPESGWKVDVMVRKDRLYSKTEFARRERASLLGVEVAIASLEDVLIAKLEWSRLGDSELQRRDVVQLLERTWARLDQAYLERWIPELGLDSEWADARGRAPGAGTSDGGVT